jgi:uncharacterized RDD family membrane protein YckC
VAASSKIDTLQSIELAEGVQIQLRVAGPGPRMLAWLLDFVYSALWLAGCGIVVAIVANAFGEKVGKGFMSLAMFVVNWFYFVIYEVRRGTTPGKKAFGLRVARTNGTPVTFGPSMLRNVMRFVDFLPFGYLFGLVTSLSNRYFQRIGDLVADTVVVYEKTDAPTEATRLRQPVTPSAPPAVLSREEQQALVQFLDRAESWTPSRREEMVDPINSLVRANGPEGVKRALSIGAWIRDS